MQRPISGIHHLTAIAGDPQRNLDFYAGTLGLRLVKKTVNFDDPRTYHFYFGDRLGRPGTILTFFPWPRAGRGNPGKGQATVASFAVPSDALSYWRRRLEDRKVSVGPLEDRFGESVLAFQDPDGLQLELVESEAPESEADPWTAVSTDYAIYGLHGVTLSLDVADATAALLEDMGLRREGRAGNRLRFTGVGFPGSHVDLVVGTGALFGRIAAGSIHHVAWRTEDDHAQQEWLERLSGRGYHVSPVMDRRYFRSIYFREPGGVLFEIATDTPGFATDEEEAELGLRLRLPPWLEANRGSLEKVLPPLKMPEGSSAREASGGLR